MSAWASSPRFFAYGTLLNRTGHAAVDEVLARARTCAEGWIAGCLVDLGYYPGALPPEPLSTGQAGEGGEPEPVWGRIRGAVLELADPVADGAVLDAYEDWDPAAPERSEFRLGEADFWPDGGGPSEKVWVYWYAGGAAGVPIASGDWKAWRARRARQEPGEVSRAVKRPRLPD